MEYNPKNSTDVASRKLGLLAKEFDVCILVTTNVDRAIDNRVYRRPILNDLHSAGFIDEVAENVIFLYRDEQFDEAHHEVEIAEFIIAKNSFISTGVGTFNLFFYPNISRFECANV